MSYQGEVIGQLGPKNEIRQLTPEERIKAAGRGQLYAVTGPGGSHWCPFNFFASYADELEAKAILYRRASLFIENHHVALLRGTS